MDDILVIGGGPAGLFSAWLAHRRGARVRVLSTGIGTTHIMPGWIGVLDTDGDLESALTDWIDLHQHHRDSGSTAPHPYGLTGLDSIRAGIAALQELCEPAGLHLVGGFERNLRLPTALGAVVPAAFAPESFAAGDLNRPGSMLIAGPAGWRDFFPALCAANLRRQGVQAEACTFDLPEIASAKFDNLSTGLARLFDRSSVRERVAAQIRAQLNGAMAQKILRIGMPAVLGLDDYPGAWCHLQDLIGAPVFEIPTLPPSVPGTRLYNIFKDALGHAGVQFLLNMPVGRGLWEPGRSEVGDAHPGVVSGVAVPVAGSAVRERVYRAHDFILATGGLYGGGITSNHRGELREAVFGLPLTDTRPMPEWFGDRFLQAKHAIHDSGITANDQMQPTRPDGEVLYQNLRVAGRLLGGYNGPYEGSTEGVWIATAYRAVSALLD